MITKERLTHLLQLESESIHILREVAAEGSADIYPRLAPTMEWNTGAADAVVREPGKMTCQFENEESVVYNKENLLNPWFVVKSDI